MDEFSNEWEEAVDGLKAAFKEDRFFGQIYRMMIRFLDWLENILENIGGKLK